MIGMAFYWFFFANNVGGGGGFFYILYPFIIPRQSRRDIVLASSVGPFRSSVLLLVRPSIHPSTLFVCPEPYLSTYWLDLIHSCSLSIPLRHLYYRGLNYCKLVEHHVHVSRYMVCSHT